METEDQATFYLWALAQTRAKARRWWSVWAKTVYGVLAF